MYKDIESVKQYVDKLKLFQIKNLIEAICSNGATSTMYSMRKLILKDLFPNENCYSSINSVLVKFEELYSYRKIKDCDCFKEIKSLTQLYVPINIRFIERKGIQQLEKAICLPTSFSCSHEKLDLNVIIMIEISYISRDFYLLNDIPKQININGCFYDIKSFINFIEAPDNVPGAINHFTSYCYRPDGRVDVYNNQSKVIQNAKSKVRPDVIFYCRR